MMKLDENLNMIIANSRGTIKPTILTAILNLYQRENYHITAEMVKKECVIMNPNIQWQNKIPAICNSMRSCIQCGFKINGEDRDFNGFSISVNNIKQDKKDPKNNLIQYKSSNTLNNNQLEKLLLSNKFKVVIICAGSKNEDSNLIFNDSIIKFKANSDLKNNVFTPWDLVPNQKINWYEYIKLNQEKIPSKTYQLYKNKAYRDLFNRFGNSLFILSAGWGLINSEYKTPNYDITFSSNKNKETIRKYKNNGQNFKDLNQLELDLLKGDENQDIVYVGGKNYLKQFFVLTRHLKNKKIIYYKGNEIELDLPNNTYIKRQYIPDNPNHNSMWHYQLAEKLANGIIP